MQLHMGCFPDCCDLRKKRNKPTARYCNQCYHSHPPPPFSCVPNTPVRLFTPPMTLQLDTVLALLTVNPIDPTNPGSGTVWLLSANVHHVLSCHHPFQQAIVSESPARNSLRPIILPTSKSIHLPFHPFHTICTFPLPEHEKHVTEAKSRSEHGQAHPANCPL